MKVFRFSILWTFFFKDFSQYIPGATTKFGSVTLLTVDARMARAAGRHMDLAAEAELTGEIHLVGQLNSIEIAPFLAA